MFKTVLCLSSGPQLVCVCLFILFVCKLDKAAVFNMGWFIETERFTFSRVNWKGLRYEQKLQRHSVFVTKFCVTSCPDEQKGNLENA